MSRGDARTHYGAGVEDATKPNVPRSVARIHRLEAAERERLAAKETLRRRRDEEVAAAIPHDRRHDLAGAIEHATRYPVAIAGLAWLVVAIVVASDHADSTASGTLTTVLFVIWALVIAEYCVRLAIVPDRRGYLRRRWIEPVTLVVPVLALTHVTGVERASIVVSEMTLRVTSVMRHHSLFRVLVGAIVIVLAGAWVVMIDEAHHANANIHGYGDAVWWAFVTVTTVGYGDKYPVTTDGRVVAVLLMLVGIGLIGTLTATVASFFVKEHTDTSQEKTHQGHLMLAAKIEEISGRLADIERRLGASDDSVARIDAAADARAAGEEAVDPGDVSPP